MISSQLTDRARLILNHNNHLTFVDNAHKFFIESAFSWCRFESFTVNTPIKQVRSGGESRKNLIRAKRSIKIIFSDGPTTESDEEYIQGPYVATLVRLSSMIESGSG